MRILRKLKNLIEFRLCNSYSSIIKSLNYFLISIQKNFIKNDIVIGYPYYLVIDPTNICNLHCPLCPTGQGRKEYPKGTMKFALFKSIIDEIGRYLYEIQFGNWGEPLLNKELYQMIRYAHQNKVKTIVHTNLNIEIEKKEIISLINSGLDVLYVSLDGITQETYEKYRKGGNFTKVISNIKLISSIKKHFGRKLPKIVWQFMVTKYNESEIADAKIMAKDLGVDFVLTQVRCDTGKEIFMNKEERFNNVKDWLPTEEKYSMYNYKTRETKRKKMYCDFLWTFCAIEWDGGVFPCCAGYKKDYIFGNITKDKFKNIWNNKNYRESRKLGHRTKCTETSPTSTLLCISCIKNGLIV